MPTITYIEHNGTEHTVDVDEGLSVMQGAVDNDVPGILADCGGNCSCATCHVFIDDEWTAVTGPRSGSEEELLSDRDDMAENSRLSCQIAVTAAMDGLKLRMPEDQF